jgi:hypoxanthine phosphoribosyltransferase
MWRVKAYNFTMNLPYTPQILIARKEIDATVKRLAEDISREYRDKNPVMLGILKGSFIFMSDLVRKLDFPLEIEFVRCSSYGSGKQSSGKVKMALGLRCDLKDRHVLIVEDIVDTGITLAYLMSYLKKKKPASLKLCALADKISRRVTPLRIDYRGFTVPDKFLVGYGLDFNEQYRYLPDICYLED